MRAGLIFFSTLILSLAAGLGGYALFNNLDQDAAGDSSRSSPTAALIGTHRADFSLNDLQGRQRSISEWDGQVLLINFWATWCPPCRREIPALSRLHRELSDSGFSVLGAAMDNLDKVRNYVQEYDVPYPNLAGNTEVSAQLGNITGSLPYTVIIDRDGIIRYIHLGEISREMALEQIRPLLDAVPAKQAAQQSDEADTASEQSQS